MTRDRPLLVLLHETEAACRDRLLADGFDPGRADEIASYLAQSTDIQPELPALSAACDLRGIGFEAVELDAAPNRLSKRGERGPVLVWTMTDGIAYFRGSLGPSLARLNGLGVFGSEESLFALCQDKFRSGAVASAAGLPVPPAGLARDGVWIVPPPVSGTGYFVKPNRLGAKIGIWAESRCATADEALSISRRIWGAYRDDAIVQAYVPGRNVRASFLAVEPQAGMDRLGVVFVDAGADFQTMADSLSLYGETGEAARRAGTYVEPRLVPVAEMQPEADTAIREIARRLETALGLRGVFSIDLRVEADDTVHLIEFEVCPGLPCFDFRHYCREVWGLPLAEAIAQAAATHIASRA
jgi:D-alanine-D-alanine ligase-like ATP-grasp enzyme